MQITFKDKVSIWTPTFALNKNNITGWNPKRQLTISKKEKSCPLYPKTQLENGHNCVGSINTSKVKQFFVCFTLSRYPFDTQTCSMAHGHQD